jgi:hypothetical protein
LMRTVLRADALELQITVHPSDHAFLESKCDSLKKKAGWWSL